MWSRLTLSGMVVCCVLSSPLWSAESSGSRVVTPPDLSGVWGRPKEKGFAFPNELAAVVRNLERTETAKARMAAYRKLVPINPTGPMDSPGAFCLGAAMPTMTLLPGGYPMEIIQRPEQITILYEIDGGTRRIYLNGKLNESELLPSRAGYSTGKWEGDTLVVETVALTDTFDGDVTLPHGEQAKIIERYRMTRDAKGNKLLNMDLTLTDPESYLKPVSISTQLSFMPNDRILPYACELWDLHLEDLRTRAAGK